MITQVKETAADLRQVYHKAFQKNLMVESLNHKTVDRYLQTVEDELYSLESTKVARIIFYKVNADGLFNFLQEHQSLSSYYQKTLTLSIKSVVETDLVIRVSLLSEAHELPHLTLLMLEVAPEFIPPRKRFSSLTPEQLVMAGYKAIATTLWSKSFYSQSEVGRTEDYRINFEWVDNSYFQAKVCFQQSPTGSYLWISQYADTLEELEENVKTLYHTSTKPEIKAWKGQLLLVD